MQLTVARNHKAVVDHGKKRLSWQGILPLPDIRNASPRLSPPRKYRFRNGGGGSTKVHTWRVLGNVATLLLNRADCLCRASNEQKGTAVEIWNLQPPLFIARSTQTRKKCPGPPRGSGPSTCTNPGLRHLVERAPLLFDGYIGGQAARHAPDQHVAPGGVAVERHRKPPRSETLATSMGQNGSVS